MEEKLHLSHCIVPETICSADGDQADVENLNRTESFRSFKSGRSFKRERELMRKCQAGRGGKRERERERNIYVYKELGTNLQKSW